MRVNQMMVNVIIQLVLGNSWKKLKLKKLIFINVLLVVLVLKK
jgi:hypothetical protein